MVHTRTPYLLYHRAPLALLRLACGLLLLMLPLLSFGQESCGQNALDAAAYHYEYGRFTESVEVLKAGLMRDSFCTDEKKQAYRLLAKSYLAMDSFDQANACIEKLVKADDNFEAIANDPIRFRLAVAYVKGKLRESNTSSVSKKAEDISLAPATIQILTARDIENRGYIDLESVFNDLPGFDITRTFGISYSVLYQRGYRAPALTERTMIMIDGREDNDLWTNAAFITKQYPLSSVKRIEIIYGPASTIYGANAFCGVINIVTKGEEEFFPASKDNGGANTETQKVAINLQSGGGSYGTKYVDGTAAVRRSDMLLTVTGRAYFSDGIDLTSDPYWDGSPSYSSSAYTSKLSMKYVPDSVSRYVGPYFQVSSDSQKIVPTAAGIKRADSLDKAYYKTALSNASVFKNGIKDFFISAKLTVHNFKFGFHYWNKNEGSIGDYVDNFSAQNALYTNWQVRDYMIYANYEKKVSEKVNLSSNTCYRFNDFGNDSRGTNFSGYGTGGVSAYGFITGTGLPSYSVTNYYQASDQLRSELKALYLVSDQFDILAGTEFTTGIMQANYITSTVSPALVNGHSPASVVSATKALDSAGGNNLTTYTISGYATGSYKNEDQHLHIGLGGRIDNNAFREHKGYGTVFNPRADIVWFPGRFVFKAIYAEAFLDASNQNKFSTASSRKLTNPGLEPEKVKNFEVSARYRFGKRNYVEIAGYRADYTHSLALVAVAVPTSISATGTTNQYQDIGQSLVYGIQASSNVRVNDFVSIYGNFTYTDAKSIMPATATTPASTVKTGDIAPFSFNAGVNVAMLRNRLNANVRINIAADKPTGTGTSVTANPYTSIEGFQLLNATLGYRIIKGILIQGSCNNMLDSRYYSPGVRNADGGTYAPRVLQPGRNYVARVTFDLKY